MNSLLAILLLLPLLALGGDLGVYGEHFEIQEPNLKTVIIEQAKAIDWQAFRERLYQQAKGWGDHLDQNDLSVSTRTEISYFDPSVTVRNAWINPLRYVRPQQIFLIIDGRAADQIDLGVALWRRHPGKLMLVLVGGNPIRLSKKYHVPFYYAFKQLMQRFQLHTVPMLLGSGKPPSHRYALAKVAFVPSSSIQQVEALCEHYLTL